jgi:hypothetical protein
MWFLSIESLMLGGKHRQLMRRYGSYLIVIWSIRALIFLRHTLFPCFTPTLLISVPEKYSIFGKRAI